jgi:4-hydroxy-tetrahydrodipicolinate synthase
LVDLLFVETNPTTAKWLLHQQGRIAAPTVRPPLAHATEAGIVRVQALLRDAADLIDLEADIL